jgi:hypothetical protein
MQVPKPRTWIAGRVGDSVVGPYVRHDEKFDKRNQAQEISVLRDSAGIEWGIWLFRPGIGWVWDKVSPQIGDVVRITRVADRQHKGRSYPDYTVEILSEAKPIPAYSRAADLDESPF